MRACISSLISGRSGQGRHGWVLVVTGRAVGVSRLPPHPPSFLAFDIVAKATAHWIVRSSWTGMTLYATMWVHPRYGEANATMSGGAKHTTYDEDDVLLPPLCQWQPTDAKVLSGFIFGRPKNKTFSVIRLWTKPESLPQIQCDREVPNHGAFTGNSLALRAS